MSRAHADRARARSDVGSAVNAAAHSGSSFAGRARMASTTAASASVTRRPRAAKIAAARRAPARSRGAFALARLKPQAAQSFSRPQRGLVERRQSLSAV
jgi:hypothetical protein